MISRRHFLLGTGAGLVLPCFFERALAVYENHGEALIKQPQRVNTTLVATRDFCDNFQLLLGGVPEQPPTMTVADYVERYNCLTLEEATEEYAEYGLSLEDEMPQDFVIDAWCFHDSPNAQAFRLLSDLDLGRLTASGGQKVGDIQFINGPCPGNDYRGVEAPTELDLSLLQDRLNQLRTGILVTVR